MRTQRLPCFYHYWYLTIATNPLGLIWWIGIMGLDEIEREINLPVISLSPNQHLWSVWYKLFIKLHPRVVSKALFSRALLPDSADWIYRSLPNNNPLRITPIVKSVKWFFKMNREPWDKKKLFSLVRSHHIARLSIEFTILFHLRINFSHKITPLR